MHANYKENVSNSSVEGCLAYANRFKVWNRERRGLAVADRGRGKKKRRVRNGVRKVPTERKKKESKKERNRKSQLTMQNSFGKRKRDFSKKGK